MNTRPGRYERSFRRNITLSEENLMGNELKIENELLAMLNQHQSVEGEVERGSVGVLYEDFYDKTIEESLLEKTIHALISKGLFKKSDSHLLLSDEGRKKGIKNYIEYYFSEGVIRSEASKTDKKYQESKNEGLFNTDSILDVEQFKFITDQLSSLRGTLYDLGCGRGSIISHIQNNSPLSCFGVDKSENMIKLAQEKNPRIGWLTADIETYCKELPSYDGAILIDSLYFVKDKKAFLRQLLSKLNSRGKILIAFSAYTKNPQEKGSLEANDNELGIILHDLKADFTYTEFTENEIKLWEHRRRVTASLKEDYIKERNSYLYYDRMSESSQLLDVLKRGLGRRYIYSISSN
jgi:SAM-dependent methyltransferase